MQISRVDWLFKKKEKKIQELIDYLLVVVGSIIKVIKTFPLLVEYFLKITEKWWWNMMSLTKLLIHFTSLSAYHIYSVIHFSIFIHYVKYVGDCTV